MPPPPPPPPPPPAAPDPPQLHGVVIITLPPPDQPSKGKTITAFTYTDDDVAPPPQPTPPPTRAPVPAVAGARRSRRGFSPRRAALMVLVLGALAVAAYYSFYSDVAVQFLGMEEEAQKERNETKSFLLPLYPKARQGRALREFGDIKLAARRVDNDGGGGVGRKSRNKLEVKKTAAAGTNSTALLPIKGNVFPDGQYYTSIFVGNPPRPYFLDVDTGSDLTWIQCDAPCTNCAKGPHPLYKPAKEKIVPPKDFLCQELQGNQNYCETCKQCDYEIEYADRSSSMGVLARDDMHLITTNGGREKLDFVFGCAYDQQGQLLASPAKTDGILGLSSAGISLPSQLANQGIISNVFGHCITRDPNGGGYMFLGDDYVPRWGMTSTPIRSGPDNLFHTEAQKVYYGDQQLSMRGASGNSVQVIFDSGSSYTYLPDEIYKNLIAAIKYAYPNFVQDSSDNTLPLCWTTGFPVRYLEDVKQLFKPLNLHFGKRWFVMPRTFTIPPDDYLIISDKGNVCMGLLNGKEIDHGSTVIVGDNALRGKLVVYDNQQRQIGWTNSDCTKPQTQKGFPFFL
uniref:Peptidase A1 domain-containing protein n=1 Tax=Oryza punctata TaxID=4537 RepID=A0A0E0K4U7_ORYPU